MIPDEHLLSYRIQKAAVRWGIIEAYVWLTIVGVAVFSFLRFFELV